MSVARRWCCSLIGAVLVLTGCAPEPPVAADAPSPSQTLAATPTADPLPQDPPRTAYGFYAPYGQTTSSVVKAPRGFEPFYLQSIGRHGSRATVSSKPAKRVRALCTSATATGELTDLGAAFCADTNVLDASMRHTGYGDLSPLGEEQWEQIGRRTAADHRVFFTAAAKAKAPIRFFTSDVERAKDSSDAFRDGIRSETSKLKLKKRVTDDDLLRFSTPLSPAAEAEIDRVEHSAATRSAATNVLSRLFGTSSTSLEDARDVWELYAIAPGMGLRLDAYLTSADAGQLAALDDAETFYRYGPSVEGTRAFDSAADLRADVLEVMEHHRDGGKTMATFRHAHAETVVPLAALLRLGPTSAAVAPGTSSDAHGWYGSEEAEMATSIDVAAYRKGSTILVAVRYNEVPVEVAGCRASSSGKYFYELDTLEKCWS